MLQINQESKISWAKLSLRLGLAFAFGYAGVGSLMQPDVWVGYLPSFISTQPFALKLLMFFSIFEIGLTIWLLSGWKVRYAGLLSGLMLAGIVSANISDLTISFRDFALIFAAAALVLLS